MKKTMLMLVAVVAMVIGLTACGSHASKFVDAINDATEKINAASDEEEFEAASKSLEDTFAEFKDDDKELSADEKAEVVDALANLIAATGCKQAEFAGQTLDAQTQALVKTQSKTMVESITKDCKSVKEIIEAIAKLG